MRLLVLVSLVSAATAFHAGSSQTVAQRVSSRNQPRTSILGNTMQNRRHEVQRRSATSLSLFHPAIQQSLSWFHHPAVQRRSATSLSLFHPAIQQSLSWFHHPAVQKSATAALPLIKHEISIVAQAVATLLAGFAAAKLKRRLLEHWIQSRAKAVAKKGGNVDRPPVNGLGRLSFYNTFMNLLIFKVAFMFLVSLFQIDLGPGLRSVFAASGVGAIIFGIASKDLAQQVVGGFVIATWDVFEEGETIHLLKSDIQGTVRHVGLMDTEIERPDNVVIKIPNSEIFNQRVSNLSRVKRSQVKQTLRFQYTDLKNLPIILDEIKDEIRFKCPFVITNGSKPFRVHLFDYREDHVEVLVNVHMAVPPSTTAYMDCRQEVLHAIGTAVERCGARFAIPAVNYYSGPSSVGSGSLFEDTESITTEQEMLQGNMTGLALVRP